MRHFNQLIAESHHVKRKKKCSRVGGFRYVGTLLLLRAQQSQRAMVKVDVVYF